MQGHDRIKALDVHLFVLLLELGLEFVQDVGVRFSAPAMVMTTTALLAASCILARFSFNLMAVNILILFVINDLSFLDLFMLFNVKVV